jgi:hypothetical protein
MLTAQTTSLLSSLGASRLDTAIAMSEIGSQIANWFKMLLFELFEV